MIPRKAIITVVVERCVDCPHFRYVNEMQPYCADVKRYIEDQWQIPDKCLLRTDRTLGV
jgi:hypothetical protein